MSRCDLSSYGSHLSNLYCAVDCTGFVVSLRTRVDRTSGGRVHHYFAGIEVESSFDIVDTVAVFPVTYLLLKRILMVFR